MKVVVSGGSGFIGTRLVSDLLAAGHQVRIFDKRQSERFPELVTIGDVRDRAALERALAGADVVYQLAAEHRDDVSPTSLYYDVNVGGARNTTLAADAHGIAHVVFTSSVSIYGLDKDAPSEASAPDPYNDYGRSKLQAEEVFTGWASRDRARTLTIVRPVVVFGEGNRGNVHTLIEQIRSHRFVMVGSGKNRKSMAYVGNVSRFLVEVLELGGGVHVFNYADKPDLDVGELVTLVRDELHLGGRLPRLPYSVGLLAGIAFDLAAKLTGRTFPISAIRVRKFCAETTVATGEVERLGFAPPYAMLDGLRRMISASSSAAARDERPPGRPVRAGVTG